MARLHACIAVAAAACAPGCTLLLDFDGEIRDAAPPHADADPLSPDASSDPRTAYEPNDTPASATPLEPGELIGPIAILPAGDHDHFVFTLDEPRGVTIDCLFVTHLGDLQLRLWDKSMAKIGESIGSSDNERIVRTQAVGGELPAGTYIVDVFGVEDTGTNPSYRLIVGLE